MDWEKILTELNFRTSRSSGAGGQHVNKTETKVEVIWKVADSEGLSEDEKTIISERLIAIISDEGLLYISSQKHRSQLSNKEEVIEKLKIRLDKALTPVIKRIRSRPSKSSIEERLAEKKIQAEKKESRRKPES
ncbi:MAG: aminoacyl-tRNA hydrolase [Bacteroidota bacterium]|nr:aminoacyl-tRNA hydrolase [Bacteroidota bacterium]